MLSSSNQAIVVAFYVLCCWQAVVQSFATLPSTATSLLHLARLSSSMTASTSSLPSISSTRLAMANDDRSLLEQMRKTLGEREDILEGAEMENKQLLQGLRDMDRDPNLRINNKFIEWLSTNGVWVKTVSTWGRAPHPLVIASNTEADGESCGRGLLAREGMGEGELLMTIPLDLCLTKATAQDVLGRDVITEDMDEYIAISLLLMTEKLKGDNSKWKAYMDILPSAENVYPSFIWSDDDLNMLLGSPVYAASKSLR